MAAAGTVTAASTAATAGTVAAAGVAVAGAAAAGVAAMAMTVATEKWRRRAPWRRLVRDGVVAAAVADAPAVRACVVRRGRARGWVTCACACASVGWVRIAATHLRAPPPAQRRAILLAMARRTARHWQCGAHTTNRAMRSAAAAAVHLKPGFRPLLIFRLNLRELGFLEATAVLCACTCRICVYVTCVRDGTCKTDKAHSRVSTSATIEFSHETKACIALSTENRQKLIQSSPSDSQGVARTTPQRMEPLKCQPAKQTRHILASIRAHAQLM